MKKTLSLIIAAILMVSLLAGCGQSAPKSETKPTQSTTTAPQAATTPAPAKKTVTLRVGVMPFLNSIATKYIIDKGWDVEAGIKIQTVSFPTGAPMNEAIGADLVDVGVMSGAAVTAIATYNAILVADVGDAAGGIEVFVRPNSPIAKIKGTNPTFPNILGDAKSVKGAQILVPVGTISQLNVLKWLEKIGSKDTDVKIVHMEYAQAYQAFLAGQGDIIALNPPLSYKAREQGWINVGGLNELDIPQYDSVLVNRKTYEKADMREAVITFVNLYYRANKAFRDDPALAEKSLADWYKANGSNVEASAIKEEIKTRPLITKEEAAKKTLGAAAKVTAEFMASIGKLQKEKLPLFDSNVKGDILKEVLSRK